MLYPQHQQIFMEHLLCAQPCTKFPVYQENVVKILAPLETKSGPALPPGFLGVSPLPQSGKETQCPDDRVAQGSLQLPLPAGCLTELPSGKGPEFRDVSLRFWT